MDQVRTIEEALGRGELELVAPLSRSKSYASRPPAAVNIDIVEGKWKAIQERIFSRAEGSLPDSALVKATDVVVSGFGRVHFADGAALSETLEPGPFRPAESEPVHSFKGPVALLRKPGDSNYGHWLIELLPRVFEFQRALGDVPLRYAIPSSPLSMRGLRLETLGWLGIKPEQIISLTTEPTHFETLYLIGSNSIHSHTHDAEGINRMVDLAPLPKAPISRHRRLFVRRPGGYKRALINEAEIIDLLTMKGFEIIQPETLTISEQVKLFAEAALVVGVSGAALTNIVWSSAPCHLISLSPNQGYEFFFWDLCNVRDLGFTPIYGPFVGENRAGHSNFTIDPAMLTFTVDRLLGGAEVIERAIQATP